MLYMAHTKHVVCTRTFIFTTLDNQNFLITFLTHACILGQLVYIKIVKCRVRARARLNDNSFLMATSRNGTCHVCARAVKYKNFNGDIWNPFIIAFIHPLHRITSIHCTASHPSIASIHPSIASIHPSVDHIYPSIHPSILSLHRIHQSLSLSLSLCVCVCVCVCDTRAPVWGKRCVFECV